MHQGHIEEGSDKVIDDIEAKQNKVAQKWTVVAIKPTAKKAS